MTEEMRTKDYFVNVPAPFSTNVLEFYRNRIHAQLTTHDLYKGVRILKYPEDLRVYERLIEDSRPEVIIELGVEAGGSSLWFADRLQCLIGGGTVIGVDIDLTAAYENIKDSRVVLIEGDLGDPDVIQQVHELVAGRRTMIIEDAAHTYECTSNALKNYWDLVSPGCWLVVEDGIVDVLGLRHSWMPEGVARATTEFMSSDAGKNFTRHNLTPYGLTSNPNGWLLRNE